jgi:hypothetical protein
MIDLIFWFCEKVPWNLFSGHLVCDLRGGEKVGKRKRFHPCTLRILSLWSWYRLPKGSDVPLGLCCVVTNKYLAKFSLPISHLWTGKQRIYSVYISLSFKEFLYIYIILALTECQEIQQLKYLQARTLRNVVPSIAEMGFELGDLYRGCGVLATNEAIDWKGAG